jgi:RND family efflux transporter MFP subunit
MSVPTGLLRGEYLMTLMFLVFVCFLASGCNDDQQPQESPPAMKVPVVKAELMNIPAFGVAVGNTSAVETVEIRSRVEGHLLSREFEDGESIKQGQLLFVIDPDQYQQNLIKAEVQLDYARASLELARKEAGRYAALLQKQLVSQENYELRLLQEQEAKANVLVKQADVRLAQIQIGHTRIASPVDGIIGLAQVDRGGLISPGSTLLAKISTIDPMHFFFSMSERDYLNLFGHFAEHFDEMIRGMNASLTLAGDIMYPYSGHLDMFDRSVDPKTGSIAARAVFPNPGGVLRPGMFGKVKITLETHVEHLLIPQETIMETLSYRSVFIVNEDGLVSTRNVTLGGRKDNLRIVLEGLEPGEMIAAGNLLKLRPGMRVKPELKTNK